MAFVLISMMLGLALVPLLIEVSAQESADEVKLYLHRAGGRTLDTIPPSPQEAIEIMTLGSTRIYNLTYPLTRDLTLSGNRSGGDQTMKLHLFGSTAVGITSSHVLDVRVIEIGEDNQENQIAGDRFEGQSMLEDELDLIFTSSGSTTVEEGSLIQLRIELEGDSTLINGFSFSYYGTPESSHLSFRARPIESQDIEISLLDGNEAPLEELLPNGPEEAREFQVSARILDAFGAYDIDSVNFLLSSGTGNTIWNQTGSPDEEGGQTFGYVNRTHTIPEGTPEGEYILQVTVTSNTGQTVTREADLTIASGLQVTLADPEREADAGENLEFSVSILNGGEGTDRVTFTHDSDLGWTVEVPDPIEIEGGDTESVIFRVQVPIRSSLGDEDTIELGVESRNAEKIYSREARIIVVSVADFGVEVLGDSTSAVVSGGGAQFSIRILNIEDSPSTFEVGVEDLPSGWSVSYSGSNGSTQGSLYILELDGDDEAIVTMNMMTSPSAEGVYPVSSYVRKQGETERRYVYLKVRVVDPTRNVVSLLDATDTKQSARMGTNIPIEYSEVFFTLELYNPSLADASISINVNVPTGWDAEYDYSSLDLLPGESSSWNISIKPREGELYDEEPYLVEVGINGGNLGTFNQNLNVELKKITSVQILTDKDVLDIVEGEEGLVNATFKNNGNHEATLTITKDSPDTLEVSYDTETLTIQPNEEQTVRMIVKVLDAGEETTVSFSIGYEMDGISGKKDVSVFPVAAEDENGQFNVILIVVIAAVVIVLAAVGFLLYSKMSGQQTPKNRTPASNAKSPSSKVEVTAAPDIKTESGKPLRAPRSEAVEKADDIAASILGDDSGRRELSGGVTVEADEDVITAELVE